MEKHIQSVYTNSKFKEFQQELKGKLCFQVYPIQGENSGYKVVEDCKFWEKRRHGVYKVDFNEDDGEVICNCKLYKFRGILCKHVIPVLIRRSVYGIPSKYIMHRWRKDIKRCHTRVKISYNLWLLRKKHKDLKRCVMYFMGLQS